MEVIVGPDKVKFYIHRERLCYCSIYFENVLFGEWNECLQCAFHLHGSEAIFQLFVNWLYSGELDTRSGEDSTNMRSRELCELWVFADKYGVLVLQNLIIDALHENLGQFALEKCICVRQH